MATRKQTYTRNSQCNHASVGLAQAHPNKLDWYAVSANETIQWYVYIVNLQDTKFNSHLVLQALVASAKHVT